jgi:hypothetical protein
MIFKIGTKNANRMKGLKIFDTEWSGIIIKV